MHGQDARATKIASCGMGILPMPCPASLPIPFLGERITANAYLAG